jgi:hypothetical protein
MQFCYPDAIHGCCPGQKGGNKGKKLITYGMPMDKTDALACSLLFSDEAPLLIHWKQPKEAIYPDHMYMAMPISLCRRRRQPCQHFSIFDILRPKLFG